MDGQKKATPSANTAAAKNTMDPDVLPSNSNPINASMAEVRSTTVERILWMSVPPNCRASAIIPDIHTRSKIGLSVTFDINAAIHWFVHNSVAAVRSIQQAMKMNKGLTQALSICL